MNKKEIQTPKAARGFRGLAIKAAVCLIFWTLAQRAFANTIFLDDAASSYRLNVQHTAFRQFNCDLVNIVFGNGANNQEQTIITFEIYGVHGSSWQAHEIMNASLKKFIAQDIATNREFLSDVQQINRRLCEGKFEAPIDTLIVKYNGSYFLMTDNIRANVIAMQSKYQDNCNGHYLAVIADSAAKPFYRIRLSDGRTDISVKKLQGDTLALTKTNKRRPDGESYTYCFMKNMGVLAIEREPYFTNKKDATLFNIYRAEKEADMAKNFDDLFFKFQPTALVTNSNRRSPEQ